MMYSPHWLTRRSVLLGGTATLGATAISSCSGSSSGYDALAQTIRAPISVGAPFSPSELIRYATLAGNSHNSQPWCFEVEPARLLIRPDRSRRLPAVDPDDHHLYCSLGCAAENLAVAASAQGSQATISFDATADVVVVDLEPAPPRADPWLSTVTRTQCSRLDYDGRSVSVGNLNSIVRASKIDGVECRLITERAAISRIKPFVLSANSAQIRDKAFVAELRDWIRLSGRDAMAARDGLASRTMGNPQLPRWIGLRAFDFVYTADAENEKIARWIDNSGGLAVFVGPSNDPAGWVAAGRSYQRFALATTALNIRHAHLNMPVEVPAIRRLFAAHLDLGDARPDLLIRFGYGPLAPYSLRRDVRTLIEP